MAEKHKPSINSREKGSENERVVAKLLSEWAGEQFNRVPASGGLRWKADNNVTGDIVAPAHLNFPFSIECKKVEIDWDFSKLMIGTSDIWGFWKQCCEDARRLFEDGVVTKPKEPLLIFTKNRRKQYVMLRYTAFHVLLDVCKAPAVHLISERGENVVILPLEVFLGEVSVALIQKHADKLGVH